jgi:hypothetical protein
MTHKVDNTANNSDDNKKVGAIIMMSMNGVGNIKTDDEPNLNPDLDLEIYNPDGTRKDGQDDNKGGGGDEPTVVIIDEVEYTLDADGNALDSEGKVFKTKDDLANLNMNNLVEVDGKEYTINEKGDAVNEAGEVVYTKAQLDALGSDEPIVNQVIKVVGRPVLDENGVEIQYDDTPIGIGRYIEDVSVQIGNEIANEIIKEKYTTYPILRAFEEHLILNNGNPAGFQEDVDYSTIQLDETNEYQLSNIIRKDLLAKGYAEDRAEKLISLYKKEASLLEEAKVALASLDNSSKAIRAQRERDAQIVLDNKAKADNQFWSAVQEKVLNQKTIQVGEEVIAIPQYMKRNIDGKIVTASNKDFFDYMYTKYKYNMGGEPVIMTQNQADLMLEEQAKSGVDYEVYEALRRFLRYDDEQIIREKRNAAAASNANNKRVIGSTGKKPVTIRYKTKDAVSNVRTS